MSKKKRRGWRDSFLMQTVDRVGFKEASKIGEFVLAWITVHADLERRPTVDEYADWWNLSARTAYREQSRFREAWPEFATPTDVAMTLGLDPANPDLPNPYAWGDPLAAS